MADLPVDRTLQSTPAEHLADHLDIHAKVNDLYPDFEAGKLATLYNNQRLFVPASAMTALVGSPALTILHSGNAAGWGLDAATTESVGFFAKFPDDWASFTAKVLVTAAGAGVVYLDIEYYTDIDDGDLLSGSPYLSDTEFVTTVASTLKVATHGPIAFVGDGYLAFRITRRGANGSDTLATDAFVLGVIFEKSA